MVSPANLRLVIASITSLLANKILPWWKINVIFACRKIALDKNSGIHLIGIEETLRRILAKCLTDVVGDDLGEVFGVDQLAGRPEGAIEGPIHVMISLFESNAKEGHGLPLLDVKNAVNSINRKAPLLNAHNERLRASTFLYNSYQGKAELVVGSSTDTVWSCGGKTQGDPLSMLFGLDASDKIN